MKRILVTVVVVGLLGGLGGAAPEAKAATYSCQVVATTSPKSCSIITRGVLVAHVVGVGGVQTYGPNGNGTYIGCPGAHLACSGGVTHAHPGYPVVLTVKKGYGRISAAAIAVGV